VNYYPHKLLAVVVVVAAGLAISRAEAPKIHVDVAVATTTEYQLHPGDTIQVRVYGEEDLTAKVKLSETGRVILPLLPAVNLNGMTIEAAKVSIRDAYQKEYLRNPVVTVTIEDYGLIYFNVLGQVRSPGVYHYAANEQISLVQAIALAGGYSRIGEPSRITIKRVIKGKVSIIRPDAGAMAEKENSSVITICPNDVITIGETIF